MAVPVVTFILEMLQSRWCCDFQMKAFGTILSPEFKMEKYIREFSDCL